MNTIDPADEALLIRLGTIVADVDPPPLLLFELGRAAFETRLLGAELAALVEDSSEDLVGVRGATAEAQVMSFTASGTTIEVEVSLEDGQACLLGQVVPNPGAGRPVHLQTPSGDTRTTELDVVGGFRFDDVPVGFVRLNVEPREGAPVTTSWITI